MNVESPDLESGLISIVYSVAVLLVLYPYLNPNPD